MRRLVAVFRAVETLRWDRTAAILATLIGIHHDPKKGAAPTPLQLNPYRAVDTVGRGTGRPYTRDLFRARYLAWQRRQAAARVLRVEPPPAPAPGPANG